MTETETDVPPSVAIPAELGITYRQLDYWTTLGYVIADAEQNPGSGAHRSFSQFELDVAAMIGRLRDADIPLSVAARLARHHVTEGKDRSSIYIGPGIEVVMWSTRHA